MEKIVSKDQATSCYTYEVTMAVQVMASTKEEADEKLDRDGGYISYRSVLLKDVVSVYTPENFSKDK
jgi:hypothetical protein